VERVRALYGEAVKVLLGEGALFTRPYGEELTNLVYERAADYTMTLRRVKSIFDPNKIMNPGKLCF
jgi:FAD/FMN-containing dehydrogenase